MQCTLDCHYRPRMGRYEPMSGSGDKRLSVNVTEANEGKMARSAKITFKAGGKETILVVTQLPAGKLAYKITVPDWSESFIYNVMLEGKKIAELCREATEGEANADGSALKKTPETIVTLYLMREDAYPEEGIVLTNGGTYSNMMGRNTLRGRRRSQRKCT